MQHHRDAMDRHRAKERQRRDLALVEWYARSWGSFGRAGTAQEVPPPLDDEDDEEWEWLPGAEEPTLRLA